MNILFRALAVAGSLAVLAGCGGKNKGGDKPKQPAGPVALNLAQPGMVTGKLTNRTTSQPLAKVNVLAQDANRPFVFATTVTNGDGTYTLSRLPLGVPLRIVSQPVEGAVVYEAQASDPMTLLKDKPAEAVNLAFTSVPLGGRVEVAKEVGTRGPRRRASLALVQRMSLGGKSVGVVVRAERPGPDGGAKFEAVPPGTYELHYRNRRTAEPQLPHRHPHRNSRDRRGILVQVGSITVKAGETAHVVRPTNATAEMADDMEALEMDAGDPE